MSDEVMTLDDKCRRIKDLRDRIKEMKREEETLTKEVKKTMETDEEFPYVDSDGNKRTAKVTKRVNFVFKMDVLAELLTAEQLDEYAPRKVNSVRIKQAVDYGQLPVEVATKAAVRVPGSDVLNV